MAEKSRSWNEIHKASVEFVKKYKDAVDENSDAQSFWIDFLGIDRRAANAIFEDRAHRSGTGIPRPQSCGGSQTLLLLGRTPTRVLVCNGSLVNEVTQARSDRDDPHGWWLRLISLLRQREHDAKARVTWRAYDVERHPVKPAQITRNAPVAEFLSGQFSSCNVTSGCECCGDYFLLRRRVWYLRQALDQRLECLRVKGNRPRSVGLSHWWCRGLPSIVRGLATPRHVRPMPRQLGPGPRRPLLIPTVAPGR